MPNACPTGRHQLAEPPEADDAEGGAGQVGADGLCQPPARTEASSLRDVPGDGEDQRPGELDAAGERATRCRRR